MFCKNRHYYIFLSTLHAHPGGVLGGLDEISVFSILFGFALGTGAVHAVNIIALLV